MRYPLYALDYHEQCAWYTFWCRDNDRLRKTFATTSLRDIVVFIQWLETAQEAVQFPDEICYPPDSIDLANTFATDFKSECKRGTRISTVSVERQSYESDEFVYIVTNKETKRVTRTHDVSSMILEFLADWDIIDSTICYPKINSIPIDKLDVS